MSSALAIVPAKKQKTDLAWKHCQMVENGEKVQLKCVYCGKIFKGGGIHRIKEHLAGHKGNGSICIRVPEDVRLLMQENLQLSAMKTKRKKKTDKVGSDVKNHSDDMDKNIDGIENPFSNVKEHDNEMGISFSEVNEDDLSAGGKLVPVLDEPIDPHLSSLVHQITISKSQVRRKRQTDESAFGSPDLMTPIMMDPLSTPIPMNLNNMSLTCRTVDRHHVHMAIGRFLYDIGAPMSAVDSVYFQPMIDAIASAGTGIMGPSYHDIRGQILKNMVEEVKNDTVRYRSVWEKTGCSLIVEQWSEGGRTLLNFLVHCPEGTVFLKSMEVTNFIHSSDALAEVLKQVVEEVGEKNVLQVITTGEEHFVGAGKRLMDISPNLYWAPCSAECIDLILKDFGECDWIHSVIEQAQCMTRFIYNNAAVLNLLRRFTFGNDIIEPGGNQFASNFVALKRLADHKVNLQGMFTSQEWMISPYAQKPEALKVLDHVTSDSFWSSCNVIIRLTNPFLRLLRIMSSGRKAAMGYMYAGIYRAKEAIKKELIKKEEYLWFWKRIDHRWEQYRCLPLQAAGFYLNPKFFYSVKGDMPSDIVSGMFDCIERLVPEVKVQDKIIKEINLYKAAGGDFGRNMAIRGRDTLLPVEWWSTYGGACPSLMRLAIQILGQACTADFGKWISFDQILGARNCLEHQRLNDLVFARYNLRLRTCKNSGQCFSDPIASEAGSMLENWITGKDIAPENDNQDWMAIDPPSNVSIISGPSDDATDDLGAGFDDYEIFNGAEDVMEDKV